MSTSEAETLLYGADPTPGIVAVEADARNVTVYTRVRDRIVSAPRELRPWLVAERETDLPNARWSALAGEGYAFIAEFDDWSDWLEARQRLTAAGADHFAYSSPVRHYLTRSGETLFKGMSFEDLRRLQLDIETVGLSPREEGARLLLVALADNTGWSAVLDGTEEDLLRQLSEILRERDPDVIEGHNIFGFDLPFLAGRAERHAVSLLWGRDGSPLRFGRQRQCAIGGRRRPFVPAYVHGRHIIDTMLGVQRFDAQAAQLEGYGLKASAQQLGLSEPNRISVEVTEMAREWRERPDDVREYARQDVIETGRLAAHVMPTDFYLSQMVPEPYQEVAVSGVGEKINALLVREHLRQGVALARPQSARSFPGGYVEVRRIGVISPVIKVDVESLYPNIMLTEGIAPRSDTLGVFLPMLRELTKRRLEAKEESRRAAGLDQLRWEGIQSSFKVLINSFYGYLGASFLFNDYEAAERVTRRGQDLVRQIAHRIEASGGQVIEIDTDGVYLKPPERVRGEAAERAYVEEIAAALPKGIRLVQDGRYRAMLSLKAKNYAAVGYDGRRLVRGAALRSRADEPFGREFLAAAIDFLLDHDRKGLSGLYRRLLGEALAGQIPIERLARRERVTEKTFSSPAKRRQAEVARGVPIGDYVTVYQRADGSLARLEDYAGDEDSAYYADRLYRFALRLGDAVGPDFESLFPRPSARSARQASAGQKSLDFD